MVCYGLVHLIVAYLALRVAFGDSGQQADQSGAVQEIGATSFGAVVLWVLTIGLVAYGAWQLTMAAVGFRWVHRKGKRTRRRIGAVLRAVVGVALGLYAGRLVTGSGGGSGGDQRQQEFTAKLLSLPAGQVLVGIVAAVVIGIAVAAVRKGVRRSFLDAQEAGGLDRALKTLAAQPFGTFALVVVAVGLAAFGVYCFAAARAHKS